MNNKEFIKRLAEKTGLTQKQVARCSSLIVDELCRRVKAGNSVMVSGFGTFESKKQQKRVIVNPGTGVRMAIPEKQKMVFKTSKIKVYESNGI